MTTDRQFDLIITRRSSSAASTRPALLRSRPDLYDPGAPGWKWDVYAEQAAQDEADRVMAGLGCRPEFCEVCGSRLYVLTGVAGPYRCGRSECARWEQVVYRAALGDG
jgi:hypothetical protein